MVLYLAYRFTPKHKQMGWKVGVFMEVSAQVLVLVIQTIKCSREQVYLGMQRAMLGSGLALGEVFHLMIKEMLLGYLEVAQCG